MNVLVISPWFPWPPFGGSLIRVYETLRHLSRRHRLTFLAPTTDPAAARVTPLDALCQSVVAVPVAETTPAVLARLARGWSRGMSLIEGLHQHSAMARQVRALTSRTAYDIIHVEQSFMGSYLQFVAPGHPAKRVLSMHNVESLRFRREMDLARGGRRVALACDQFVFASWEKRAVGHFDGIAAVSGLEERWARAHAPEAAVTVVPNGVDTTHFSPAGPPSQPRSIIFTGLMNFPPNADAVMWFCDAVLPLVVRTHPDVRFVIAGDKPLPEVRRLAERPGVEVTGRVEDIRRLVEACAVVVVPIRSGAGTRLKILEAMAMQRPVVSTTLGAEGLSVTDRVDILLADTAETFAARVRELLEDPALGEMVGSAGRHLVEQRYDWQRCLAPLDGLYEAVVSRRVSGEPATELAGR